MDDPVFSRNLVPLNVLENALLPQTGYYHLNPMPGRLPPSPPYGASSPSPSQDPRTPQSEASSDPQNSHKCEWIDCSKVFSDPETLYAHLCNDHIGRKSTNNLCLTCNWKDCGTTCAKRDHITSHLRVHTPLKPHVCEICNKTFKRPQDLKKHEKIHTEEHHAQHKHSKAITVADPAYVSRVRGEPVASQSKTGLRAPLAQTKSDDVLPTPSPELSPGQPSHDVFLHHQAWEQDGSTGPVTAGTKRSHDYSVDQFFSDMKKRRVNPSYDPHMVDRLNAIAYAHHMSGMSNPDSANYDPSFNPRSVSFDVRTPQELAAVNEFLITLGRDVAQGGSSQRRSNYTVPLHGRPDEFASHSYFDATSLSHLGLAGMPGMPGSGASYSDTGLPSGSSGGHHYPQPYPSSQSAGRSSHPSMQPSQFTSMYHPFDDGLAYSAPEDNAPIHEYEYPPSMCHAPSMSAYQRNISPQRYFHSTPPYDSHSSQSSVSTPSNATPPHIPVSMPDLTSFGYLAEPRGPPPVANLAPVNYTARSLREIIPLKTAPGSEHHSADISSPPEPVEPKLAKAIHRGPPAKLMPSHVSASTRPGSLYPLLTSGDTRYKLAPLNRAYRSQSPVSSRSTVDGDSSISSDSSPSSSPAFRNTVLPSLRSIAPTSSIRRSVSDELAQRVERIELDRRSREDERRKHAELIRYLIISINTNYKIRFGTPKVKEEDVSMHLIPHQSSRDVEMTA